MTVVFRRTSHEYLVTVDDKDYRVVHDIWAESKWNGPGEKWRVITSHTCRECDPEKTTHKHVVEAVKEALANGQ
jgi:hypothetical protein